MGLLLKKNIHYSSEGCQWILDSTVRMGEDRLGLWGRSPRSWLIKQTVEHLRKNGKAEVDGGDGGPGFFPQQSSASPPKALWHSWHDDPSGKTDSERLPQRERAWKLNAEHFLQFHGGQAPVKWRGGGGLLGVKKRKVRSAQLPEVRPPERTAKREIRGQGQSQSPIPHTTPLWVCALMHLH